MVAIQISEFNPLCERVGKNRQIGEIHTQKLLNRLHDAKISLDAI
jgi:hypothetical protein